MNRRGCSGAASVRRQIVSIPRIDHARTLTEILDNWRNRRREEQHQLLEAMASTERESAKRVLQGLARTGGERHAIKNRNRTVDVA
jgi:hypothetical protein